MNTTATRPSSLAATGVFIDPASAITTADLHAGDRCDTCGAAALVRVVKGSMELVFCGSHARAVVGKLQANGWSIDDQTYRAFEVKDTSIK